MLKIKQVENLPPGLCILDEAVCPVSDSVGFQMVWSPEGLCSMVFKPSSIYT